jgi:hypothetical protein
MDSNQISPALIITTVVVAVAELVLIVITALPLSLLATQMAVKVAVVQERLSEPGILQLHGLTQAATPQHNLLLPTVTAMLVTQVQRSVLMAATAMAEAEAVEAPTVMVVRVPPTPHTTESATAEDLVDEVS